MNHIDTPNSSYLVAHGATAKNNAIGSTDFCTHQVLTSANERSSSFTSSSSSMVSNSSSYSSPVKVESSLESLLTLRPSSRYKLRDSENSLHKEMPRRGREKYPQSTSLSSQQGKERKKDRSHRRSKSPIDSLRMFASGLTRGCRSSDILDKCDIHQDTMTVSDAASRLPKSSSIKEEGRNKSTGRRRRSKSPVDTLRRMTNGLNPYRRTNSSNSLNHVKDFENLHDNDDDSNGDNNEDTSTCPAGTDDYDDADAAVSALLGTINDKVFQLGHDVANLDKQIDGHLNMAVARRQDGATLIGVVLSMRKVHSARQTRSRAATDQAKLITIRETVDEVLMTSGPKGLDLPTLRREVYHIIQESDEANATKVPNDQELVRHLDNLMLKERTRTSK